MILTILLRIGYIYAWNYAVKYTNLFNSKLDCYCNLKLHNVLDFI